MWLNPYANSGTVLTSPSQFTVPQKNNVTSHINFRFDIYMTRFKKETYAG
jgi:hypothetical protein